MKNFPLFVHLSFPFEEGSAQTHPPPPSLTAATHRSPVDGLGSLRDDRGALPVGGRHGLRRRRGAAQRREALRRRARPPLTVGGESHCHITCRSNCCLLPSTTISPVWLRPEGTPEAHSTTSFGSWNRHDPACSEYPPSAQRNSLSGWKFQMLNI